MDTVSKLSRAAEIHKSSIRFIGVPKTIDNDLILTDHTPGFGSAAKYVAASVCEIGLDASGYEAKSVTIIEIMAATPAGSPPPPPFQGNLRVTIPF